MNHVLLVNVGQALHSFTQQPPVALLVLKQSAFVNGYPAKNQQSHSDFFKVLYGICI